MWASCAGSLTRLERFQVKAAEKEDEWLPITQLPHMATSEQLYHNVDGVARGIDEKSVIRVFVGLLGMYVSHSRCLLMVCTTIHLAKEEPMTNILGQGEERDLDPCLSVLICYERRWHYINCHVSITKLYVAVLCSAASFGQTDVPRAWLCRRLRPSLSTYSLTTKLQP